MLEDGAELEQVAARLVERVGRAGLGITSLPAHAGRLGNIGGLPGFDEQRNQLLCKAQPDTMLGFDIEATHELVKLS